MGYQCKLCECNFTEGYRIEITLINGIIVITYVCRKCREKHPDNELHKKVIRKLMS